MGRGTTERCGLYHCCLEWRVKGLGWERWEEAVDERHFDNNSPRHVSGWFHSSTAALKTYIIYIYIYCSPVGEKTLFHNNSFNCNLLLDSLVWGTPKRLNHVRPCPPFLKGGGVVLDAFGGQGWASQHPLCPINDSFWEPCLSVSVAKKRHVWLRP